jgi:hypothetical protein
MPKHLKKQLLSHCIDFIDVKYKTLQSEYRLYQESAANETKSTAGDKHDTSKSMMQLEQEKLGHQMDMLLKQKKILGNIDVNRISEKVEFGSVVETDQGNFFISISAKEFRFDDKSFIPVSIQSPLAMAMLNCVKGKQVKFNNKAYKIESIF